MSLGEHPKEVIDWGANQQKADVNPESKYGFIAESLRQSFPEAKTCSMFCGGKKCKYCDPEASPIWNKDQKVIEGLYSNWVTENILAMSRPSSTLITKYKIVEQFQECGIRSVINLQRPGEHSTCGPDKLKSGGFSYEPEEFMTKDVFFYNFGWQDYNVGSLTNILDMVKVMQFALSEGKVGIHCHAGLGRTGVLIACYLIFANRISANEAINYVRLKRPGSIQTGGQLECIRQFVEWLQPFLVIYASAADGVYSFTLHQYLERQKHFLHGLEARKLRDIPKIVAVCCSRLLTLAGKDVSLLEKRDLMKEQIVLLGLSQPKISSTQSSPCLDKKDSLDLKLCHTFDSFTPLRRDHQLRMSRSQNQLSDVCSTSSGGSIQLTSVHSEPALDEGVAGGTEPINEEAEKIAHAMAQTEYSEEVLDKVKSYKIGLNNENGSWDQLSQEKDPLVLSALLWDWIDHLKEPILHAQDLPQMLEFEEPCTGLGQLDKGARATVVHLVAAVALLQPNSETTHICVLQRLVSTLTHQNMVLEPLVSSDIKLTSSTTSVMRDYVAIRLLAFFKTLILSLCRIANHDAKKRDAAKGQDPVSGGDCIQEEDGTAAGRGKKKGKRQSKEKGTKVASRMERDMNGMEGRKVSRETGEMESSEGEGS